MGFTPTEPKRRHSRPSTSQARSSSHPAVVQNRQKNGTMLTVEPRLSFSQALSSPVWLDTLESWTARIVFDRGGLRPVGKRPCRVFGTQSNVRFCFVFLPCCPVLRSARYSYLRTCFVHIAYVLRRPRIASGKFFVSLNGVLV